jgi:hypothetical protein
LGDKKTQNPAGDVLDYIYSKSIMLGDIPLDILHVWLHNALEPQTKCNIHYLIGMSMKKDLTKHNKHTVSQHACNCAQTLKLSLPHLLQIQQSDPNDPVMHTFLRDAHQQGDAAQFPITARFESPRNLSADRDYDSSTLRIYVINLARRPERLQMSI